MRHKIMFVSCGLLLSALMLCGLSDVQSQQSGGKTVKVKLLLPVGSDGFYKPTKVLVDGKEVEGTGDERSFVLITPAGKDYVTITAIWDPNNYTTIKRPRKVTAKDGVVVVEFPQPRPTLKKTTLSSAGCRRPSKWWRTCASWPRSAKRTWCTTWAAATA